MVAMHRFTAATESEATVRADRSAIWDALSDPELLPRLTPFLERIVADGEHWRWEMQSVPLLGSSFNPCFTERMVFDPQERIEFTHAPPAGSRERTGVEGWYALSEVPEGTHLGIRLAVSVELPVSRLASPAVTTAMKGVMATMGRRFSHNLLQHVGAR